MCVLPLGILPVFENAKKKRRKKAEKTCHPEDQNPSAPRDADTRTPFRDADQKYTPLLYCCRRQVRTETCVEIEIVVVVKVVRVESGEGCLWPSSVGRVCP